MSESSDAALVAAVLCGDVEAFGPLVDRYQSSLYGFVRSRLDGARAEDCCQEIFVAAWQSLAELRDPAAFGPWLFGIARRKVANLRRREATTPALSHHDCEGLAAAPRAEPPPDELIPALLEGLSDDERLSLLLRFRDELSYREIAETLGRPIGTVSALIHRARKTAASNLARRRGDPS